MTKLVSDICELRMRRPRYIYNSGERHVLKSKWPSLVVNKINSGTDTIASTSSSQHQRKSQTNTTKQPQKEQTASRDPPPPTHTHLLKKWQPGHPNPTPNTSMTELWKENHLQVKHYRTLNKKHHNESTTLEHSVVTQLAFYVNLHRAVIGPSATLTGRWRPDIDLRRMLTGKLLGAPASFTGS